MRLSPAWLQHVGDGFTITDVVFPGFLFIVGVAIPFALHKKWANFLLPIGVNPLLAYIMPDIVRSLSELVSSVVRRDVGKLLWPFRAIGGWPGHINAITMTLVILLCVRVMTKANVILKL